MDLISMFKYLKQDIFLLQQQNVLSKYLWKQIMWSFSFFPNQCQNIFPCVFHWHCIPSILWVVCIFNMIVQFALVIERRLKLGCAYYLIPFNINWMKYYLNKKHELFRLLNKLINLEKCWVQPHCMKSGSCCLLNYASVKNSFVIGLRTIYPSLLFISL